MCKKWISSNVNFIDSIISKNTMKAPKTITYVPDQKYHNAKTWAIGSTAFCMVFLLVILWMVNEIHRLHNYIDSLYPL